ncbi:MAG: gliding motility-associated C-terminal domain-containing protein [Paludibacteraceae bacterium]|nr:gliding motility-associated C-terminal domain-containing protein [Paludibacteraceae bacterium]
MKSIKFNRTVLCSMLLSLSALVASGQVCQTKNDVLTFSTGQPTGQRLSLSDVSTSSRIAVGFPSKYTFAEAAGPLSQASYVISHNPNQGVHEGSYNYLLPATDEGNIFLATKDADGKLPFLELTDLVPEREYKLTFTLMNPAASWGNCKPASTNYVVFHTQIVNPATNDGTGINAKSVELYDNRYEWNDSRSHRSGSGCTNYEEVENGRQITYTYTFSTMGSLTSARLFIEELAGYGYMTECSLMGLSDITLEETVCLSISSPTTIICEGKVITLSATNIPGVVRYNWFRKYANETNFVKFKETPAPSITDAPTDTAQYYVSVSEGGIDLRSAPITINVADRCLYITPHYSSDLCTDEVNTLVASGSMVLGHTDSEDFAWEEYDEALGEWKQLDSHTMKQKIKPEKTTKYRVIFGGESTEYVHTVAPCASLVCQQLESKTVFLETFGFFMDSVTYVDTKDEVRYRSVHTESAGDLKIERYWAPDPYDYVVYPTEFTQAINSSNNEPVTFAGQPVMCGTNGHQFALLDPRNPDPTSSDYERRNGGYQWCHNENTYQGNYRVEDGFYALVRNPVEADCGNGDFWDAKDHTGNRNGAMLMVNCGPTKATIYSQKVNVGCSDLLLNFSAYLANAISPLTKEGEPKQSMTPVQITFKIFDKNMNLLGSEDSDPIVSSVDDKELVWSQQSMQFKSNKETELYVQLVNNGESGYGNDILLDDISFSICLPKVVLITVGMDMDSPEVVRICNDTTITLKAVQKQNILENPLFRFQYRVGNEDEWKDVDPNSTDYTSDNITISSSDSRFWGEVEFRVVAAENMEVLNKVIQAMPLSSCDMYSMANSTLTIINNYHGPMSPDEEISVCKGDNIEMKGSRECDKEGKWLTDWEWEWQDATGKVISGYYRSSDLEKKVLPYTVKEFNEVFYFVAYDDVCSYKQKFTLIGKNVAKITANASLWTGCDSLMIIPDSLTIESEATVAPKLKWTVDGSEVPIIGDTLLIKPAVTPVSGVVRLDVLPDDYYCPLASPLEIPYRVNAGNSLSVSLSAGDIKHLCLDPEKYDSITLHAKVTPEGSSEDVKLYLWSVNGMPLDTTASDSLIISTDPKNKFHDLLVPGAKLKFEVRIVDGVCFTVDNPSDPGSFYLEVNETYSIKLESYPNDSICLTDLQSDTILVLTATATSVSHPGNDVQSNIKTYVWSVDGVKFAETTTSEYVLLKSDHPSILDKYLKAGTSPVFSVSAIDSICFQSLGDAPSGDLKVVFNEAYSMIVSPDGKTICVPEHAMDENMLLLTLSVETDPRDAINHVQEFMWYLDGVYYRSTTKDPNSKVSTLALTYKDLKDMIGENVKFSVKSYDGICSTKQNPAENGNDVNIDIRSGGYTMSLSVDINKLCIDTLNPENNKIELQAHVVPTAAVHDIDYFYWMDNGYDLAKTEDTIFVLTQKQFPNLFKAGKTAIFNVKTYDAVCAQDSVFGTGSGEQVLINESYKMELLSNGDSICYDDENQAVLNLQAEVTPSEAANHIRAYRWYRDGVLLETTTTNSLSVTNAKYPGSLVPGAAHSFKVDSYDEICYSADEPATSPSKPIVIGFKYELKLTHIGKDSICLGTDSVVLKAKAYPRSTRASIQLYIWTMELNGVEKEIARTKAPEDSLVISQERFPDLFSAGTAPIFRVKSVDGICYKIDNPNVSDEFVIRFNTNYSMKLKASSEVVCFSEGDDTELVLTAEVDPAAADTFIKWYRWYKDGVLIDSTKTNYIKITQSRYPKVLVPGIKATFKVDSYDGFCFTAEDPSTSDGVDILINQKYDMKLEADGNPLCMASDFVILKAVVSPDASKNNIKEYIWKVNGEEFARTDSSANSIILSQENYPELLDRLRGTIPNFSVESYDGICYTIDNPSKSDSVGVAIGSHFKITLEAPSDSICFDGRSSAALTLKANVDPVVSAGLVKAYRWYKNGELIDSTKENFIEITEAKYPGVINPGENPTFSVDAYDDICYTSENPAKSAGTKIVINFKFSITLDNGGKDYVCIGSDSLTIRAIVTPAGSALNIQRYYWTKDDVVFDTTTVNYIVISRENYPDLFQGSSFPNIGVKAVDGICYTDEDPAVSPAITIRVNKLFDLSLKPNTDVICASGANSTVLLTAIVNPYDSEGMIERYVWHKVNLETNVSEQIGEPTAGPTKEVSNLDHGEYAFYVEAYDGVCFSVNPASSDSVNVTVHENIFVTLSADRLKFCTESSSLTSTPITLTAKVTQGTPNKFEVFDAEGSLFLVSSSEKTITFTVYPTLDNHEYVVKAYDGVCNNNDATAATTGNPLDISVYNPIDLDLNIDKKLLCLGDTVHMNITLKSGSPVQYEWSAVSYGGRNISVTTNKKDSVIMDVPTEAGYLAYTLIASDGICDDKIVSVGNVLVKEPIELTLRSDVDNVVIGGSVNFLADVTSGDPVLFTWKADDRVVATTVENTLYEFPKSPSVYTVVATDSVCSTASAQMDMTVQLPTAFTPYDKDGLNDIFMETFKVTIFNRFGQVIYEGDNGWDGSTYSNMSDPNQVKRTCGAMADPGVYFYSVILKDGKESKGSIEVVKM